MIENNSQTDNCTKNSSFKLLNLCLAIAYLHHEVSMITIQQKRLDQEGL